MPQLSDIYLGTDANLKGYWKMESDGTDSSSSGYNLTVTGSPSFVVGRFGNCPSLTSGSSQYLSIADASCPNLEISGSQSWGAWVKLNALPTTAEFAILGKSDSSATGFASLFVQQSSSGNKFQFSLGGVTTTPAIAGITVPKLGVWYFVCGIYNGSTNAIYVNGILENSGSASGTHTDTNGVFAIGKLGAWASWANFNGYIDDAFIFNRALTAQEVLNIYQSNIKKIAWVHMGPQEVAKTALAGDANLKAYYRFESGALTTDSTTNTHTLTAIGTPTETTGKFGGGVALTTNQAYSIVNHADIKPTGEFSVNGWIKPTSASTGKMIFQNFSQNTNQSGFYIYNNSTGKLRFLIASNTGSTEGTQIRTLDSNKSINDGNWHHFVCVFNTTKQFIYIDGILDNSVASTIAPVYATTTYPRIGAYNDSGTDGLFFEGVIDDLALFNGKALTDLEIYNLYNSGIKKLGGVNNVPVELSTLPLASDANLQGYWKFESNGNDTTANARNLTITNSPAYVTGRYGSAIDLERGSSQYGEVSGTGLNVTGSQSWGCWIKMESINDMAIVGFTQSAVGQRLFYINATTGKPTILLDGLTTNTFVTWDSNLSIDVWYHVVGVYSSSESKLKLWVNGVKKEVTASGTALSLTGNWAVGRRQAYTDFYFDGIIDDLFMFDRALTDAEVLSIYDSQIKKFVGVANR